MGRAIWILLWLLWAALVASLIIIWQGGQQYCIDLSPQDGALDRVLYIGPRTVELRETRTTGYVFSDARHERTVSRTLKSTRFRIPFAAPLLLLLMIPITWLACRQLRRSQRLSWMRYTGRCARCGYDLRASSERCPECGTPFWRPPHELWNVVDDSTEGTGDSPLRDVSTDVSSATAQDEQPVPASQSQTPAH